MSSFSPEWLKLREGADKRARNPDVAGAVSAWFLQRPAVSVVDLGSGTGSNLRALAPLLPEAQSWRLIDLDPELLAAAQRELVAWADRHETTGNGVVLFKGSQRISVTFTSCDLSRDLESALGTSADLITASAFFDLASESFIKSLARAATARRAAFYGVLTYNGLQKWTPHRPSDNAVAAGFNRHQMSDKGFGPAAGPLAAPLLADQFRLEGYSVIEGDSPWRLGANDRMLIEELQRGQALAVLEIKALDTKAVETWVKVIRSGAEIGHTDIFAMPA